MGLLQELNEQRWQSPPNDDKELLDWLDEQRVAYINLYDGRTIIIGLNVDVRTAIRHAKAQAERRP